MINDDFFDPDADKKSKLRAELNALQEEHSDLGLTIDQLGPDKTSDQLLVRRLKKRKLALKDRIAEINRALCPTQPDDTA